jgi:hypothetical protein
MTQEVIIYRSRGEKEMSDFIYDHPEYIVYTVQFVAVVAVIGFIWWGINKLIELKNRPRRRRY